MPRSRNHPHSRQEWEAIRPIFTRLYKVEDKKLSDVMEILATEHGFRARELHYKRRIFTWGLDKKKKLSEMAFAARVIQDRRSLGKDTRIQIRGDTVSQEDVRRYWRRKSWKAENSAPVACTPPGLRYCTPTPALTASSPAAPQSQATTTSEGGDNYMSATVNIGGHQAETFQYLQDYEFRTSLGPVMTPDRLRNQELVLHQAKMYMQGSLEVCHGPENSKFNQEFFRVDALVCEWLANLAYEHAPYTAAMTELKIYDMVPQLSFEMNPSLLMSLMVAANFIWAEQQGHGLVSQGVQKLLSKLLQHTSAAYSSSFQLATLFHTMAQHINEFATWTKAILELAADLFLSSSSNGITSTWWLFLALAEIYRLESDCQTSLHYAKRAETAAAVSHNSLEKSLCARETQIKIYIGMTALDQAEAEINDALAACLAEIHNGRDMWDLHSSMLYHLSGIRRLQGRQAESRHLADQSLSTCLEHYGPQDGLVMRIVYDYNCFYSVHATDLSGQLQSGCQEPLSWRCEQVDSLYGN
ncbi:hypothetical protein LTR10_020545 [Elasticomyces elasticus]|uniref:Clr5 domain-containing protein n=1 Tax=Exophiala sideris TaxID=1016849 RepID=A0ABR0J490_9EURO|nr:hypothetical protein LTR10_020545 [Elasticomyces elasticus]KAK5027286.1 hypothetical protein LTS07_006886 [Exophiala sideris]KAK5035012.1 hypothetical protein LTR13_006196 [Exophiala sideris]KAK5056254.1 hypothetical protein LTR69_007793 [Exophiala sideris]KAK5181256.1 hypothetical protein LTR44_006589 [Eurotiomycetes sp. CCFEE 6388]